MPNREVEIPTFDFLTLGETLLRMSPPGMQRIDQARLFEVGIGGSGLNVACVLASPRAARCLGVTLAGRTARPHRRRRSAPAWGGYALCPLDTGGAAWA